MKKKERHAGRKEEKEGKEEGGKEERRQSGEEVCGWICGSRPQVFSFLNLMLMPTGGVLPR